MEVPFPPSPSLTFERNKFFIFGSNLNQNIFTCLPLINNIIIWKERKEKFERNNVLDLVWDNHCDARSHIPKKIRDPMSKALPS